jgi:transcription elongation factor Elf1
MESVVQVVRGFPLNPTGNSCVFCGKESVAVFSTTKEKKFDGALLKCFPICNEHFDKLNALLSGEFNIDEIFLDKHSVKHSKKVQLRS